MARAPFNVLVIPFCRSERGYRFAVLHRSDAEMWQFVAGGGEADETPAEAARREASEEAGIVDATRWTALESTASIPRSAFPGAPWPDTLEVIPEHCFAVELELETLALSHEHDRHEWLDYAAAYARLTWDSNGTALAELRERLGRTDSDSGA
ncbi:MAG: NUDIX pyrophosphatase [Deltaproteobacteria bacterium]|nr:NUDIX pyrophosphatase [Nannocystaceae bacterium]